MKNKNAIMALLICMLFIYGCSIPDTPEEELKWCLKNKPPFNTSVITGLQTQYKVKLGNVQQKCFTEHWSEYCKVSYPEDCPKNNYSG